MDRSTFAGILTSAVRALIEKLGVFIAAVKQDAGLQAKTVWEELNRRHAHSPHTRNP